MTAETTWDTGGKPDHAPDTTNALSAAGVRVYVNDRAGRRDQADAIPGGDKGGPPGEICSGVFGDRAHRIRATERAGEVDQASNECACMRHHLGSKLQKADKLLQLPQCTARL